LSIFSYGDYICGASTLCLPTYINVGIVNGVTLPLIIFWVLASVFSYCFFTLNPKVPLSLTLFFLFKALLKDYATIFLLISNAICISSVVLLTLVYGFYGLFFCGKKKNLKIFAMIKAN
jgi:hypothetical protein